MIWVSTVLCYGAIQMIMIPDIGRNITSEEMEVTGGYLSGMWLSISGLGYKAEASLEHMGAGFGNSSEASLEHMGAGFGNSSEASLEHMGAGFGNSSVGSLWPG
ncbi:hypothetical protein ACOMHN_062990 [Nucella lapillus]